MFSNYFINKFVKPQAIGNFQFPQPPWVLGYCSFHSLGGVDHGGVDHHVVVDKLRRPGGVGPDTAHGPGHQEDVLRAVGFEPVVDGRLVPEVKDRPTEDG